MRKRDPIFWMAAAILVASMVLASIWGQAYLFGLVAAYLLRPTLHSLGFFPELIDERQTQIQYRAGNLAFVTLLAGVIVVMLILMARNDHAWELLVPVLLATLIVRALGGLLMTGDHAAIGPRIIMAAGLLVALFGVAEGWGTPGSVLSHIVPGLVVAAIGYASRYYPRVVALGVLGLVITYGAWLVQQRLAGTRPIGVPHVVTFVLVAGPLVVAVISLFRHASDGADPAKVAA